MIEILLVIVIILLIVNIYISIKPQGVDMGPVQRDMEQKLISVEKALREEFTVNREESRKNEQSNRIEIGSSKIFNIYFILLLFFIHKLSYF